MAEILRQVRRIEVRTRRLVDALGIGAYRSAFRGAGMEFDSVREYVPGDDVRAIDWNVTARANRPYVKLYRTERELTTWVVLDASASMRCGGIPGIAPRTKLARAAEAAAVVLLLACFSQGTVGLAIAGGSGASYLPRRGRPHALRLAGAALTTQAAGDGSDPPLGQALAELAQAARRRGVVVVVSDFLGAADPAPLASTLGLLARRHEVVAVRVADPAEDALPAAGVPLVLEDPETGRWRECSGSRAAAAQYARAWQATRAAAAAALRGAGCGLVEVSTTRSATPALTAYLRRRQRGGRG